LPHRPQNWKPSIAGVPHAGHDFCKPAPQRPQNRCPAGFSVPHEGQITSDVRRSHPDSNPHKPHRTPAVRPLERPNRRNPHTDGPDRVAVDIVPPGPPAAHDPAAVAPGATMPRSVCCPGRALPRSVRPAPAFVTRQPTRRSRCLGRSYRAF
jgi:hypothetical protein